MKHRPVLIFKIITVCIILTGEPDAANFPFPQGIPYPYGIKPNSQTQATMNDDVQQVYNKFLQYNVTNGGCPPNGYRVTLGTCVGFSGNANDTYSEAMGWGMLITVYMDNPANDTKKYFDGFNIYRKNYLNSSGLMSWEIDQYGNVYPGQSGPAIEADENMALALMMAHYQWGSTPQNNYQQDARDLINNLMNYAVLKPQYVMKPGDTWGGIDLLHPCNWAISYFRVWNEFTGDAQWLSVFDASINLINYFYTHYTTGLMPHWCKIDGSPTGNSEPYFADYTYEYDACQTPFRYGLYYLWYGTDRSDLAFRNNDRLAGWINAKTGTNAGNIRDGYQLDGTTTGSYNSDCFVATFGVAAMSGSSHQAWLNSIYDHIRQRVVTSDGYYNTLIRLICMLAMTGNLPNLQAAGATGQVEAPVMLNVSGRGMFPNPLTRKELIRLTQQDGWKIYDLPGTAVETGRVKENDIYFLTGKGQTTRKVMVAE